MTSKRLMHFWREEDAQDIVEYALLLAFIALSVVSLLGGVNGSVLKLWTSINSQVSSAVVTQAGS